MNKSNLVEIDSQETIILSDIEKESAILLSVLQLIKSMVNHSMLCIGEGEEGFTIRPNESHNAVLFNIFLVDFLSSIKSTTFGHFENHIAALKHISANPHFDNQNSIKHLIDTIETFDKWISYEATFEGLWLPSIGEHLSLKMKRSEFIIICGDISKHNQLRLSKTAERIFKIIKKTSPNLNLSDAITMIDDFYEWFHQDIFYYHLTKICELLNNIAWGIQNYLSPEFHRSYTINQKQSRIMHAEVYFYKIPKEVTNELGEYFYWGLMNEIRAKPIIKPFKTSRYLEGRH